MTYNFMNAFHVYLELGQTTLRVLRGGDGLELELERGPDGRLIGACREKLARELPQFFQRKGWLPRARALCAIGARGVSLRRLALPRPAQENLDQILRLQIESEFPLPPDELAWGYRVLPGSSSKGAPAAQEFLVAAVKKEVVEDYAAILSACGLNPAFTLGALARSALCPATLGDFAMLDLGRGQSELTTFEHGVPAAIRVLPFGKEQLAGSESAAAALAQAIGGAWHGKKLYVTGGNGVLPARLAGLLGLGVDCEGLRVETSPGQSATLAGLKKQVEGSGPGPLFLQVKVKPVASVFRLTSPVYRKWLKVAACLLAGVVLLPYAEALAVKPFLARKYADLAAQTNRLATIRSELDFLLYLKKGQPPYLDALFIISKASPPGSHIDQINMNRRGEMTLRGSINGTTQVADFRTKLMDSGFFASVSVDEQVPAQPGNPNGKLNIRITAQWKDASQRDKLKFGPTEKEIAEAKEAKPEAAGGPGGPMGMPTGVSVNASSARGVRLPPGVSLPPGVTLPPGVVIEN